MEEVFSFLARYSPLLSMFVTVIVGYLVLRLEPFKVRDVQFEKSIARLYGEVSVLRDFLHEIDKSNEVECRKCRKEIDDATNTDRNEITKINGDIDLLNEKLGKHEQFYYESQSFMESKAEILREIDNLKHRIVMLEAKD